MNTQVIKSLGRVAPGAVRSLRAGRILPLGSTGGRLEVLHGRVWLTRAGDLDDHVIDTGQGLVVPPSGRALVEAWGDDEPALVAWRPRTWLDRIGAAVQLGLQPLLGDRRPGAAHRRRHDRRGDRARLVRLAVRPALGCADADARGTGGSAQ